MNIEDRVVPGKEAAVQEYNLVGERSMETHYYLVQTEVATHSNKGVLKSTDIYRERLMVEPGDRSAGETDSFTCTQFSVQRGDGPEVTIPSLQGFSYQVDKQLLDDVRVDEQGQLYGIPEAQFEDLIDSPGEKLLFEAGKGSVWRNGEVTLEFRDLGEVDGKTCAILGLDWGECTWAMPMTIMPLMPLMRLKTVGVSTCRGDIYLDLETKWVRKLVTTLSEETVTTMWGIPVERSKPLTTPTIRVMGKDEFDRD